MPPEVEFANRIQIDVELKKRFTDILQRMFPDSKRVVVEKEFLESSFSGSWVFLVHFIRDETPELPVVVKMASVTLIEREWRAYSQNIQGKWPGIASVKAQPVSVDGMFSGLCYSFVGEGIFPVESLRRYCLSEGTSVKDIQFVFSRLSKIIERGLRFRRRIPKYRLWASYEPLLPFNLVIKPVSQMEGEPTLIRSGVLPAQSLKPNSYVCLENFVVAKVNLKKYNVTLNLPQKATESFPQNSYYVCLQFQAGEEVPAYKIGQTIPVIEGVVIKTRACHWQEEMGKIMRADRPVQFNLAAKTVSLPNGTVLPNPVAALKDFFGRYYEIQAYYIHGDLNLENILVDPLARNVRLIDFAEARWDHVLHDFLRLEAGIVTEILPLALAKANLPAQHIYQFYRQLHCATFYSDPITSAQPSHPALEKPFVILKAIRRMARDYGLFHREKYAEYYDGLTLYLLGTLKFGSLNRAPDEPKPWPKEVAFWGAATAQHLLQDFSPCRDLIPVHTPLHRKWLFNHKTGVLPMQPTKLRFYHNLPQPNYGRFVGRETELAKVVGILRPYPHSQYPLVTIDGIGGIGKTVLALEIAHRYWRHYDRIPPTERFDAIIWTSAKQTVLTAEGIVPRSHVLRTLDEIYETIAVTLQREDIIRSSSETKAEKIRHALTQQRTLLIVDNLETVDDEGVMDFLRELPAPTKAIVTTRHRLDVAYPVRLIGMPWKNAKRLMAQECEKKGVTLSNEEAHHLYKRTAGVPLAIVWSIAQISLGHATKTVLTRLGEPNTDIARFCFEASISSIQGKPANKLLIALSLFTTDASRDALGQVTGLPELDRDDGLVVLEKLSLLNKFKDRFSLLPLTKKYVVTQLKGQSELEAELQLKMIDYFLALSGKLEGSGWRLYPILDKDVKNIQLVMEWAYQLQMWREFGEFVNNLSNFLHKRGRWHELVEYAEMAVELGEKIGNKRIIMNQKLFGLGWIKAIRFREFEAALKSTKEGKEIAVQLGDKQAMASALRTEGVIYKELGQYNKARERLQHSLEICHKSKIILWEIRVLGSLCENEWKAGHLNDALVYCSHALQKSKETAETEQIAINLRRKSEIFQGMGRFQDARSKAAEALNMFEQMNVASAAARCLIILAEVEGSLGRIDEAKKQADRAYQISVQLNLTHRLERAKTLLEALNQEAGTR